jgi:phenylacetate-CoA ligase
MIVIRFLFWILRNIKSGHLLKVKKVYKKLLKTQYWDKSDIDKIKEKVIINLLNKLSTSEHYNKYLVDVNTFNFKTILQIPHLTKEIIKYTPNSLYTAWFTNRFPHTTSGSTGDPLKVYISSSAVLYRKALIWRYLNWWGLKPYDKSVLIWGRKATANDSFLKSLKKHLSGRLDINVFALNERTLVSFFLSIENFQPKYIRGYKSAILELARLMSKYKLSFKRTKLKVAMVTSEVLYDDERSFIEKTLACPVANEYGAAEAGFFACECPKKNIHINEETQLFYTDTEKNVIVTEIFNDSMPLINYKIGDRVSISENLCPCGRKSRIIKEIFGRESEYIITTNGDRLSQYVFYYIMKELDDVFSSNTILQYKIIQKDINFTIYIVPGNSYSLKVKDYISERMHQEIDRNINIEFIEVSEIERDKSGKFRFFLRTN